MNVKVSLSVSSTESKICEYKFNWDFESGFKWEYEFCMSSIFRKWSMNFV